MRAFPSVETRFQIRAAAYRSRKTLVPKLRNKASNALARTAGSLARFASRVAAN